MELQKVLVLGAGTMGRGIAQWFAQQNVHVQLVDIDYDFAKKSEKTVLESWDKLLTKGKFQESPLYF